MLPFRVEVSYLVYLTMVLNAISKKYDKIESTNYFGDDMSIDDYRPTYMVEAIYDLRANDLLRHGITAVLVDLDNTLIAWNNPDGTPEVRAWLDEMTIADISVVVVSNNKHSRVERAVSRFGVDFISRALKPFAYGIESHCSLWI